ncbi:hypothetical protein [Paenibacillus wynnii]|uniref:hypothetical protein n=1 Tax=Paenibacillus wynnii TaxID=268407 RepID=UPI0027D87B38|nr:hypothetical protein [Paenibacillus wynnii]
MEFFHFNKCLTNMDVAEKIVYLEVIEYNERFGGRVIRGFGDLEVNSEVVNAIDVFYTLISSFWSSDV